MLRRYIADHKSLVVATLIVAMWCVSLLCLLNCEVRLTHLPGLFLGILWQTFINTGLFITAHEAMHGLICPQNPRLNRGFGVLAISLYGLFSYEQLLQKHWLHHRYPASIQDPDYHNGKDTSWFLWYVHFLKGYWNWRQFCCLTGVVILLGYVLGFAPINLGLFWGLPLVLSSLQLFYFGTFLPHSSPPDGYDNFYRAKSINLPVFWSFLSCYHFGYHREHHQYPHVPWWQLPKFHFQ